MPSQVEAQANLALKNLLKDRFKTEDKFKGDSRISKLLAYLSFPFNPYYMEFITVRGSDIYWPDSYKDRLTKLDDPWRFISIRAHEGQHLADKKRLGSFIFTILYTLPHILAILALGTFLIPGVRIGVLCLASLISGIIVAYLLPKVAVWFYSFVAVGAVGSVAISIYYDSYFHVLPLVLSLFLLSPVSNAAFAAWGRTWLELRGYALTLAVGYWRTGWVDKSVADRIVRNLSGSAYYFSLPYSKYLVGKVDRIAKDLVSGDIFFRQPWAMQVYEALKKSESTYVAYPTKVYQ